MSADLVLTGVHIILYVADQAASARFYSALLGKVPRLNVPGMTEFDLPGGAVLGCMPASGITRLLGPALPDPASAAGVPRCELYLLCADAQAIFERALAAGAVELSAVSARDWGDRVGYCLDPDGHVVALAERQSSS